MTPEQTSILFQTEFEFAKLNELRFGESFARVMFNDLSKPGGHCYKNFNIDADTAILSTAVQSESGITEYECRISNHAIRIEESGPKIDFEEFVDHVKSILEAAKNSKRKFPPIIFQRTKIQCLHKPVNVTPLVLLAGNAAAVYDKIDAFRRAPAHFGIRFRFLPDEEDEDDTDEDNSNELRTSDTQDYLNVRFETWPKDPTYLMIEAVSTKLLIPDGSVRLSDSEKFVKHIRNKYDFLHTNCVQFLDQFDRADEDGDDHDAEDN